MDRQLPLIPVSQGELNASSYRLEQLLQAVDDAIEAWDEAKQAHKDHLAALRDEIKAQRATIRRARTEVEEGLMSAQVEALLNQQHERGEG